MVTRPSLQDLSNREEDSKCLFLQLKEALTRPSLQDRVLATYASCLGSSEVRGSCVCIQDVFGDSPSSNEDFDRTMPYGTPAGFVYNRDHLQVYFFAKVSFLHSGRPFVCNSAGSSHVDWE